MSSADRASWSSQIQGTRNLSRVLSWVGSYGRGIIVNDVSNQRIKPHRSLTSTGMLLTVNTRAQMNNTAKEVFIVLSMLGVDWVSASPSLPSLLCPIGVYIMRVLRSKNHASDQCVRIIFAAGSSPMTVSRLQPTVLPSMLLFLKVQQSSFAL